MSECLHFNNLVSVVETSEWTYRATENRGLNAKPKYVDLGRRHLAEATFFPSTQLDAPLLLSLQLLSLQTALTAVYPLYRTIQ
jgi:hypothetical protein